MSGDSDDGEGILIAAERANHVQEQIYTFLSSQLLRPAHGQVYFPSSNLPRTFQLEEYP